MDLFELGRLLHSGVGLVALVSFWFAAAAAKGSQLHRRSGRVYLLSLIGVMTLSALMVAGRALQGDPDLAIFADFLISIVGTASWLMWFSIRFKHDDGRLHGVVYRCLALWLVIAGPRPLRPRHRSACAADHAAVLLCLAFGLNMWRLALARVRDRGWWLRST